MPRLQSLRPRRSRRASPRALGLSAFLLIAGVAALACRAPREEVVHPSIVRLLADDEGSSIARAGAVREAVLVPAGGSRRQTVRLPSAARMRVSLAPQRPRRPASTLALDLRIRVLPADGTREILLAESFDGASGPWRERVIDLSAWTGDVDLEFSVQARRRGKVVKRPGEGVGILVGGPVVFSHSETASRPDILLVLVDTLRADGLGCYGAPREVSPEIDALCSRSVVFDAAYAASNWTLPSIASILSGVLPRVHGAERSRALPKDLAHLADVMRSNGYFVAGFHDGAYLYREFGLNRGFEVWDRIRGLRDADRVRDWLKAHEGLPKFVLLHTFDVHSPYGNVPAEYARLFAEGAPDELETLGRLNPKGRMALSGTEVIQLRQLYDGGVRFVAAALEGVLRDLDERREIDAAYVFVVADHGEEFGDHGAFGHGERNQLFREVTRVPLIVSGPGIEPRRVTQPVETLAILPTLIDLLDLRAPADLALDGSSFAGLLVGGAQDRRALSRSENAAAGTRAVRGERWSLVESDGGESLYDLARDPGERTDVLPEFPSIASELAKAFPSIEPRPNRRKHPAREDPLPAPVIDDLRALGYVN